MAKTIAILGAGGTMGLAIATKFGKEGFNVGLVARNQENLDKLKAQLAEAGVTSVATTTADITDQVQSKAALDVIKGAFGSLDVVEYSPAYGPQNYRGALDVTYDNTKPAFDLVVGGAIKTANLVVPDMIAAGSGALLFIAGGSALAAIPPLSNVGIAHSGLRNYVTNLHGALASKGIYVGAIYVAGMIKRGTEVDPDNIAAKLFEMYQSRDKVEDVVKPSMPPGGPGGPGGPPPAR
ncbi:SDR family NAD(P)-dependent oxidoreductase [Nitrospirillum viridazoti]|uniref:Short subunit dehydrogenase n=1 Tax=Nitrospirillum amazonense TaxID=28077 RepID=A0A560HJZ9_9PROT|nr:SDR family NAD(P)-dependent oxidoreductase [Nitrospirillum amazonense]TWB46828.1 short subunit dehydrogenase [Nitrospirillum amazonense]